MRDILRPDPRPGKPRSFPRARPVRAPSRAATPSAAGRGLEEARIEAEYDGDSGLVVNDADWPG